MPKMPTHTLEEAKEQIRKLRDTAIALGKSPRCSFLDAYATKAVALDLELVLKILDGVG
jgi:hypothetical protein